MEPWKWNPERDTQRCCGCGRYFKPEDEVYPPRLTVTVSVHYRRECAIEYNELAKEYVEEPND